MPRCKVRAKFGAPHVHAPVEACLALGSLHPSGALKRVETEW